MKNTIARLERCCSWSGREELLDDGGHVIGLFDHCQMPGIREEDCLFWGQAAIEFSTGRRREPDVRVSSDHGQGREIGSWPQVIDACQSGQVDYDFAGRSQRTALAARDSGSGRASAVDQLCGPKWLTLTSLLLMQLLT
ncbi:hypothetical protein [Nocardia mangyaensis]|uniref:hypothetical protein n=1 Tax=Nocardia mangyaensis TaxID=2213200 RepID=UPI0026768789|nr:hypothetical protein [Nocardia mangyaensis]MDO3650650.1 hypothetical protein [Nocardia mangyaensis]